jgi:integrase
MAVSPSGHIEQLPSGSFRVSVYAGTDPLTGRELRFRETAKSMTQAQIQLGKMLEQAEAGRRPDSRVLVRNLLAQYLEVTELEPSTRSTYESYVRRIILPAFGSIEVRKVRGPMLDTLYARLRRCGDVSCTGGKPSVEHNVFPVLSVEGAGRFQRWQRIADTLRAAARSGELPPGAEMPSARQLAMRYDLPIAAARRALETLVGEGILRARPGQPAVVSDIVSEPMPVPAEPVRRPASPPHDCKRSGCRAHACKPLSPATIRQIHSILSGAFAAAVRWEWIERNPASSAKLPKARPRRPSSPEPEAVAKVIKTARDAGLHLLALYLWLAAVTGARRGELCGLQWQDVDRKRGILHVAFNYLVRAGAKIRKDTKTHQDRYLALDTVTLNLLTEQWEEIRSHAETVGVELSEETYIFSNDPLGTVPWNPDWATHKVAEVAEVAGVALNIKALRHYTASQLLAGGIDLRNTAARLGHGDGGATTLRHYADPVSEVDRRAAAYLADLTSGSEDAVA